MQLNQNSLSLLDTPTGVRQGSRLTLGSKLGTRLEPPHYSAITGPSMAVIFGQIKKKCEFGKYFVESHIPAKLPFEGAQRNVIPVIKIYEI